MPSTRSNIARRVAWCARVAALGAGANLASAQPSGLAAGPPDRPPLAPGLAEFAQRVRDAAPRPTPLDTPLPRGADSVDFGRGPLTVYLPDDYDGSRPRPLIILLHGFTSSGPEVEAWLRFAPLVNEYGYLYVHPTGTSGLLGPFWNATDACCNLFGSGVDDVAYLRGIIDTMSALYSVDPERVHLIGHSNGGFMAYRMACEASDVVASVVSIAGATYNNPADCTPGSTVHTLQVHGTADSVIDFNGGCIPLGGCYPSAIGTAERWAALNGCSTSGSVTGEVLDLDAGIAGAESSVARWDTGCDAGGSAELWTIPGGAHSPPFSGAGRRAMIEFLLAHPKAPACPADFNDDGAVNVLDVVAFIGVWDAAGPGSDANGDGSVNVLDVVDFIAAWSAGCP